MSFFFPLEKSGLAIADLSPPSIWSVPGFSCHHCPAPSEPEGLINHIYLSPRAAEMHYLWSARCPPWSTGNIKVSLIYNNGMFCSPSETWPCHVHAFMYTQHIHAHITQTEAHTGMKTHTCKHAHVHTCTHSHITLLFPKQHPSIHPTPCWALPLCALVEKPVSLPSWH